MLFRRTVGLVIKPRWVEAVELRQGLGGKVTLTKSGRFPILSDEPEKMIQAIQGALQAAKIHTKDVVLGLPSSEVLLRHFTLPEMPKSEWRQAVQFEARKYIPFKMDELTWNFHATEQPATHQLRVVFVGAQQATVAHYVSVLAQAGVKPVAVESPSVGLARMVLRGQPALAAETIAVTEVSGEMAHIMLVKDGVPCFARDVSLAGREETKPVEDFLATAGEAAAGSPGAGRGDERLDLLISELHYSFNYFLREFPDERISRVLLCGEPVSDEWMETLTKELHISAERTPEPFRVRAPGTTHAGAWAVAGGLAMSGLAKGGLLIPLEWRGGRQERQERTGAFVLDEPLRQLLVREATIAACLLAGVAFIMHQQVAAVRGEIASEQQTRETAVPVNRMSVAELQQLAATAEQRAKVMQGLVDERVLLTPKLEALARLLPEGTWLDQLTYEARQNQPAAVARTLGLRGRCFLGDKQRELSVVTGVAQRLKDSPQLFQGFATAELSSLRSEAMQKYLVTTFEVRCASGGGRESY